MYPNSILYQSGVFVHEQVKELLKLNINVEVIAPIPYSPKLFQRYSSKWKLYNSVPKFEIIDGVRVFHPRYIALPGGKLKQFWGYIYAKTSEKIIKNILLEGKIDLFHVHGTLPDDDAVAKLSQKYNIPFIAHIHGASVFALTKRKSHFNKSMNAKVKAKAIISVSKVLQNKMKKFIGNRYSGKFHTIYNGYKKTSIVDKREKHDDFVILFVGTIYEQKGIRYLIEAFQKFNNKYRNTKLVVIGDGSLLNEMKLLSQKLGVDGSISFKGSMPHSEVLMEYSQSDIFVLPSWNEGFGVVYLEALAKKIPIVGSKGFGISDIIVDGENGFLVEPQNSEEIFLKIELLFNDSELRKQLAENGYQTIEELTWKKNAQETISVYKSVLSEVKSV
jgi:glycosyltransferase involved in cell wall biosynthesis